MYRGIYKIFNHWFHGGNIWFYSDPHFNDSDMPMIRFNYISDEEQIHKINSKVGKNDTIVILGDIGDISFIPKIKGYKVLVCGNHDQGPSRYERKLENGIDNHFFDEVYDGVLTISKKIILSHEPLQNYPYALNIHGHTHNFNNSPKDIYHLNVCAEHINYTPISLTEIIDSGRLSRVTDIHKEAVNHIYSF